MTKLSRRLFKILYIALFGATLHLSDAGGYLTRASGIFSDEYSKKSIDEVVQESNTWEKSEDYILKHLVYESDSELFAGNYAPPFALIHQLGAGVCHDGSVVGAALLMDDSLSYDVNEMILHPRNDFVSDFMELFTERCGHSVALVYDKEKNKYGSLGINPCDNIEPVHDTPEEVFDELNLSFLYYFKSFRLQNYEAEYLLEGMHFLDKAIYSNKKNSEESNEKTNLYFAYAPIIEGEDTKYVFVKEEELKNFKYKNVNEWENRYHKSNVLTQEEFFRKDHGNSLEVQFLDFDELVRPYPNQIVYK